MKIGKNITNHWAHTNFAEAEDELNTADSTSNRRQEFSIVLLQLIWHQRSIPTPMRRAVEIIAQTMEALKYHIGDDGNYCYENNNVICEDNEHDEHHHSGTRDTGTLLQPTFCSSYFGSQKDKEKVKEEKSKR